MYWGPNRVPARCEVPPSNGAPKITTSASAYVSASAQSHRCTPRNVMSGPNCGPYLATSPPYRHHFDAGEGQQIQVLGCGCRPGHLRTECMTRNSGPKFDRLAGRSTARLRTGLGSTRFSSARAAAAVGCSRIMTRRRSGLLTCRRLNHSPLEGDGAASIEREGATWSAPRTRCARP